MRLIPFQYQEYICTNGFVWMGRIAVSVLTAVLLIGGLPMFEQIPDIKLTIAITALVVVAWVGLVSYSKFIEHKKKNKDIDEDKYNAKYAIIPYFAIPVIFGAVSVTLALLATCWVITKGYIETPEAVVTVASVFAVIINCILDKYLVNHVGDAVYFQTIEDKVSKTVEDAVPAVSDAEQFEKMLKLFNEFKKA